MSPKALSKNVHGYCIILKNIESHHTIQMFSIGLDVILYYKTLYYVRLILYNTMAMSTVHSAVLILLLQYIRRHFVILHESNVSRTLIKPLPWL